MNKYRQIICVDISAMMRRVNDDAIPGRLFG